MEGCLVCESDHEFIRRHRERQQFLWRTAVDGGDTADVEIALLEDEGAYEDLAAGIHAALGFAGAETIDYATASAEPSGLKIDASTQ
jgi:hypothetical protein